MCMIGRTPFLNDGHVNHSRVPPSISLIFVQTVSSSNLQHLIVFDLGQEPSHGCFCNVAFTYTATYLNSRLALIMIVAGKWSSRLQPVTSSQCELPFVIVLPKLCRGFCSKATLLESSAYFQPTIMLAYKE